MAGMVHSGAVLNVSSVQLQDGKLTVQTPSSDSVTIPVDCIRKSKLLEDLVDSTDGSAVAEVPVTPAALRLWLHCTQESCHSKTTVHEPCSKADRRHHELASGDTDLAQPQPLEQMLEGDAMVKICSQLSMQDAQALLEAADVLIDEGTKSACARSFWNKMIERPADRDSAIDEAIANLPDHLQLALLSRHSLADCLSHLPPSWHPLALRAHHPSIDTHATLALNRLPIASVHTALSAAATLTTLRALSLAGLTLPFDGAPCIHLLEALPALTALNLHDIGLRQPTATAVAAVLPTLRQLRSLDLSNNLLTTPVMRSLAPALRQCTALRTLNLHSTLDLAAEDREDIVMLAAALHPMQQLTALALGGYTCPITFPLSECARHGINCKCIMSAIQLLPQVVDLQLDLFSSYGQNTHPASAVLTQLAQETSLERLRCTVPQVSADWFCSCLGTSLTRLTSLHLDCVPMAGRSQVCCQLQHLGSLTCLQCLWLRVPMLMDLEDVDANDACSTLAQALLGLSKLSNLQLRAAATGEPRPEEVEPDGCSVVDVVVAALAMPHLRVLHVPFVGVHSGHEQAVGELLKAARRVRLSVDLAVRVVGTQDPVNVVQARVAMFVPMLPYVESLDLKCDSSAEAPLQPLVAELSSLRQLRELTMWAADGDLRNTPVVAVLNSVSCMSQLEKLEFCAEFSGQWRFDAPQYDGELAGFVQGMPALTHMTCLMFDMYFTDDQFPQEFLRGCGSMRGLQVLDLGRFWPWGLQVCGDVLPQLPLRVLDIPVLTLGSVAAASAASLLRRLQHLRCLVASCLEFTDDEIRSIIRDAVSDLPALQLICGEYK